MGIMTLNDLLFSLSRSRRAILFRKLDALKLGNPAKLKIIVLDWIEPKSKREDKDKLVFLLRADATRQLYIIIDEPAIKGLQQEKCQLYVADAARVAEYVSSSAPTLFDSEEVHQLEDENERLAALNQELSLRIDNLQRKFDKLGRPRKSLSDAETEKIVRMHRAGSTINQIAQALHISNRVISRLLKNIDNHE